MSCGQLLLRNMSFAGLSWAIDVLAVAIRFFAWTSTSAALENGAFSSPRHFSGFVRISTSLNPHVHLDVGSLVSPLSTSTRTARLSPKCFTGLFVISTTAKQALGFCARSSLVSPGNAIFILRDSSQ